MKHSHSLCLKQLGLDQWQIERIHKRQVPERDIHRILDEFRHEFSVRPCKKQKLLRDRVWARFLTEFPKLRMSESSARLLLHSLPQLQEA